MYISGWYCHWPDASGLTEGLLHLLHVHRFDSPGFDSPGFDSPVFDSPVFDRPGFDSPGFDRPGFDRPGFDRPGFDSSEYKNKKQETYYHNSSQKLTMIFADSARQNEFVTCGTYFKALSWDITKYTWT